MGLVEPKPRRHISLESESYLEGGDDQIVDEIEVLKCLESDRYHEDDDALGPAKGIANGVVFGAILWVIAIATYLLAVSI